MQKLSSVWQARMVTALLPLSLSLIAWELWTLRHRVLRAEAPIALAVGMTPQPGRARVVVLLRPADCPSALDIIDRWNGEFVARRIVVSGVIISSSGDTAGVRAVAQSYDIQFPVSIAPMSAISRELRQLRISSLPVAVLFDASGQVRAVIPSRLGADSLIVAGVLRETRL